MDVMPALLELLARHRRLAPHYEFKAYHFSPPWRLIHPRIVWQRPFGETNHHPERLLPAQRDIRPIRLRLHLLRFQIVRGLREVARLEGHAKKPFAMAFEVLRLRAV